MSTDVSAFSQTVSPQAILPPQEEKKADSAAQGSTIQAFEDEDGPSFADFLDIINPLQNLPIIGSIYRYITGDERGAVPTMIGGALFGGPLGMAFAAFDVMTKGETGKDVGGNVMAVLFDGDAEQKTGETMLAKGAGDAPAPEALPAVASSPTRVAGETGPVQDGDYLIFGHQGSPVAALDKAASAPAQTPAVGATRDGFMVFGTIGAEDQATQSLLGTTRDVQSETAAQSALLATTKATFAAEEDEPGTSQALSAPGLSGAAPAFKGMPVPERTGRAAPKQSLPPPTTGTGAIPGGASEARLAAQAGAEASPPVGDNAETMKWFSSAFNRAMDRYEQTQAINDEVSSAGGAVPSASKGDSNLY